LLGYRVCKNECREFAFEKVALYAMNGVPTHMSRQLRDGTWTSKCGPAEDITHSTLDALESYHRRDSYGKPVLYMRRLIVVSWFVRCTQCLIQKRKELANRLF
jgi:hypothetical protein